MTLQEFNLKMKEFSDICTTLESGRQNMEILFDFISSNTIDDETRVMICKKLFDQMPVLVASYNKLQTRVAYVNSNGIIPPTEEIE